MYCSGGREHLGLFKRDLKEASEDADRRSGSRESLAEGTAVEQVRGAKYDAHVSFENRKSSS